MRLGILLIGSELLQGKIADANAVWLAKYLRPFNIRPQMVLTVADDEPAILSALATLYAQVDVVMCSGGLGPTPDDITKATLGKFFGKTMHASSEARAISEANYQRFSRELPAGHGYGFLPQDFSALDNSAGFAPGLWFSDDQRMLMAAPGVPREWQAMITDHFPKLIAPHIKSQGKLTLLNFRTWGVPEEKIFGELAPGLWDKLAQFGDVSSLPHVLGVDIGVTLKDDKHVQAVKDLVHQSPVKPHLWHEGFESLEEVVVQEAVKRKLTFGFAESCTGGLCAHRITNVAGSSSAFWGSVVSYDNSIKQGLLGVKTETLKSFGAVSSETAQEMASGALKELKTDITIALTGIAGPGGGSAEKPVGTVWMGLANAKGVRSEKFQYKGDRETLKMRFSQIALFKLLALMRE